MVIAVRYMAELTCFDYVYLQQKLLTFQQVLQ